MGCIEDKQTIAHVAKCSVFYRHQLSQRQVVSGISMATEEESIR